MSPPPPTTPQSNTLFKYFQRTPKPKVNQNENNSPMDVDGPSNDPVSASKKSEEHALASTPKSMIKGKNQSGVTTPVSSRTTTPKSSKISKRRRITDSPFGDNENNTPSDEDEHVERSKEIRRPRRNAKEQRTPSTFKGKNENPSPDSDVKTPTSVKRRRIIIQESSSDEEWDGKERVHAESEGESSSDYSSNDCDDEEVTTPDEDSDVEMVDEKKSSKPKSRKKDLQQKTPKSASRDTVKDRLVQFTPSGSFGASKSVTSSTVSNQSRNLSIDRNEQWPHLKLDFLLPNKMMDNHKRKPSDPDYNPRTLFIPTDFLNKLTPAMRQWWILKSQNFDTILFFKVGKFYEFYHMDAVIAVEELSIAYMKGDYAHSGFPEVTFTKYSSMLVEKGYKVARIEQTETPDSMNKRCSQIKATKFDKVVRREICQISTRGVRYASFQDMRANPFTPESTFLYGIVEDRTNAGGLPKLGICFVDSTIGHFYIGQFKDDRHFSRLRTLMSHKSPVQILYERNKLSSSIQQLLNNYSGVRKDGLTSQEFWDGKQVLKYLAELDIFRDATSGELTWPDAFQNMTSPCDSLGLTPHSDFELGLKSFGGVVWYLKHCLLDHDLLSLKKFSPYRPVDSITTNTAVEVKKKIRQKFMVLDGITLRNLDITEGPKSLISIIDRCNTHFGKRLLRQWICMPLAVPEEISDRLDAVEELMLLEDLKGQVIPMLKTLPDLERLLNKVHYLGSANRSKNHPDGRAVFFDEKRYSKHKIFDLTNILKSFKTCKKIIDVLQHNDSELKSSLLSSLVKEFPHLDELLNHFDNAFDHNAAIKDGKIIPRSGVDAEYDGAKASVIKVDAEANAYLKEVSKELRTSNIKYFGTEKKRFQLEVSDNTKVPRTFEMSSSRKGFKRYVNDQTKKFLAEMLQAEAVREEVLRDIIRRIFEKFDTHRETWKKCVECIGKLDALFSLAIFSGSEDMCRPRVVYSDTPYIDIKDGRHPCISMDVYIPNSCSVGSNPSQLETSHGSFILLTGPNMGGKSTLMRQVGVLAILSHIGCYVPASVCELSVVDRIFTRLGANDNIGDGESTFFVEMSETSAILKHATDDSLILMDELGRGTATYDGTAIAYAVSTALVAKRSRSIFSTHYHTLVDSLENISSVELGHMACMVENENEDDPTQETITFLYKMTAGACPKSYGFNAARLAGIPDNVVREAHRKAKEFEASVNKVDVFRKIIGSMNKLSLKNVKAMGV